MHTYLRVFFREIAISSSKPSSFNDLFSDFVLFFLEKCTAKQLIMSKGTRMRGSVFRILSFLIEYGKFQQYVLTRNFFREIAMFSFKLSSFNNLNSAIMNLLVTFLI